MASTFRRLSLIQSHIKRSGKPNAVILSDGADARSLSSTSTVLRPASSATSKLSEEPLTIASSDDKDVPQAEASFYRYFLPFQVCPSLVFKANLSS